MGSGSLRFRSLFRFRGPIPCRRGRTPRPRRIALIYVVASETSRHRIRRAWTSTVVVGRYTWLVPWKHPYAQARSYPCWSSCWSCWGSQGSHCTSSSVSKLSFTLFYLLLMLSIILFLYLLNGKPEALSVSSRWWCIFFREYFLFCNLNFVGCEESNKVICCSFL